MTLAQDQNPNGEMTVGQLIELLDKYPRDRIIKISDDDSSLRDIVGFYDAPNQNTLTIQGSE